MSFETVLYEKHDLVAVITLNRPDRLNAINQQMLRALGMTARHHLSC